MRLPSVFQLASGRDLVFDCAMGKYDEGTEVVFYECTQAGNRKFVANSDGTVTPAMATGVVLDMQATSVGRHDQDVRDKHKAQRIERKTISKLGRAPSLPELLVGNKCCIKQ